MRKRCKNSKQQKVELKLKLKLKLQTNDTLQVDKNPYDGSAHKHRHLGVSLYLLSILNTILNICFRDLLYLSLSLYLSLLLPLPMCTKNK